MSSGASCGTLAPIATCAAVAISCLWIPATRFSGSASQSRKRIRLSNRRFSFLALDLSLSPPQSRVREFRISRLLHSLDGIYDHRYSPHVIETDELIQIFQCFCDETRLRILNVLSRGPLCVCHLQDLLEQPQV